MQDLSVIREVRREDCRGAFHYLKGKGKELAYRREVEAEG
jgi:hypothetical protein